MDLAHNKENFTGSPATPENGGAQLFTALMSELTQNFSSSADIPREVLVAALQESMRQFESLLSCVSGTFYRFDMTPPRKMEFIGPNIEALTGLNTEGYRHNMSYKDIIVPEDLPVLQRAVRQAIDQRESFTIDHRIRHSSGEIRWVNVRGAAIYDDHGQPLFIEGFLSDITETKRLEAEAEKSRQEVEKLNQRMSRILEGTLDAIATVDRNWNYTFTNDVYHQITQTDHSIIGQNALALFSDVEKNPSWPEFQKAMENRETLLLEYYNPEYNLWYELYAIPDEDGLTTFYRDISDRKRLESTLVEQANTLRSTLDLLPAMVWSSPPDGISDFFNTNWHQFIGLNADEYKAYPGALEGSLVHPDDWGDMVEHWYHALEAGEPFEGEYRLRHHSGEFRWVLARAWPQKDEAGNIVRWYGASTDIHQHVLTERELQESRKLRDNILDASSDCIKVLDLEGRLIEINTPGLRALEVTAPDTILANPWPEMWPSESRKAAWQAVKDARNGEESRFIGFCPTAKGEPKWWDVITTPIRNADGAIANLLCISRDITEQRATAERLRIASEQDALTRLPNRRVFERHLQKITAKAAETGANVGLMLLDLDYFKHVNDTLGHLAGDHLLQVIANRLKVCTGHTGFVARLGGDEFAVVLNEIGEEKDLIDAASRILASIETPVTYAGKLIDGGVSIGCAMYPRDATDAHELFKLADTALYDLKDSGRGGVQMFSIQMMEAAERTANQLTLARRVIYEDSVEPFYQPKVLLDTGEVKGFEALLRWWCSHDGIQPPSTVAEAFSDYELATKIGNMMLGRVIADIGTWLDAGLDVKPVSINAAPAEFLRDDYAERLLERLRQAGIPQSLIEIEITEHVFLERRSENVVRALHLLNEAGVRIALDDFGTGYSSLSHLRDFPVDVLKIDRSFVSRMQTDPAMLAIVQAITKLGPSLSLDIVAEGVETPEQLHTLRDAGCQFGQGYLFGKAMDSRELAQRLASSRWPFRAKLAS